MNQLPESIRREAKRLLKISQESNGVLSVKNLSHAQELVSRLKGASSSFDALEPAPKNEINALNLAMSIGNAMTSQSMILYRTHSDEHLDEIVVYLDTDDFIHFGHTIMSSTESWDPYFEVHGLRKYSVAISLVGYDYHSFGSGIHSIEYLFSVANKLFTYVKENKIDFAFTYVDEGEDKSDLSIRDRIELGDIHTRKISSGNKPI